jgi:predicted nucleic acid-binding protein
MEDVSRQFYTSELIKLELLPKATFHGQKQEIEFYRVHLDQCNGDVAMTSGLCRSGFDLASRYGLAAMDALHVAAAIRHDVEEFITTELPGKPLFRVKELRVVSLHQLRNVP